MASKKKLLQAAAGIASGESGLNVEQLFSSYVYDGNGTFQTIKNDIGLGSGGVGSSAEFRPANSDDTEELSLGNANYITSGDFTIECFFYIIPLDNLSSSGYEVPTIFSFNSPRLSVWYDIVSPGGSADEAVNAFDTTYRFGSTNQHPVADYEKRWVHLAVVRSSGSISVYVDGTQAFSFTNTTDYTGANLGIGNDGNSTAFQGYISNFRVVDGTAVYTSNFTPPTEQLTAISGTTLLTCTGDSPLTDSSGNSHNIAKTGDIFAEEFGPFDSDDADSGGMVFLASRNSGNYHIALDTERGGTSALIPNSNESPRIRDGYITSFNSNGFTVGDEGDANYSINDFVGYTFRKAPKFFDIVTATAPSSGTLQVSHNLGSTPGCIILKSTSASDNWVMYHRGQGANYYNVVNDTQIEINVTGVFDGITDTYFTLDTGKNCTAGRSYVVYLFAHNDGDGEFGPTGDQDIIKCGSYTGNGSSTGPEIDLGFEPQFLLLKNVTTDLSGDPSHWWMFDTTRRWDVTSNKTYSKWNDSAAEELRDRIRLTNNGFEVAAPYTPWNGSGDKFIYIAIRRGPMATITDRTKLFAVDQGVAASDGDFVFESGFPVDLLIRTDPTTSYNRLVIDRLRGNGNFLGTNLGDTQSNTAYGGELDNMEGVFTDTAFNFANHYAYMWKRSPGYLDFAYYEGTGSAQTIDHQLGVVPEMMWIKNFDQQINWRVYHKDLGATKYLILNNTDAQATSTNIFNDTEPTDSAFTVGTSGGTNGSGSSHIAYLFATLDGVSKVGSYTGTGVGNPQNIDCGFQNGARFILIKPASTSGGWRVFDTERGIVSGNDPYFVLNSNAAQTTVYDTVEPYSSGFTVVQDSSASYNTPGVTYIFYAIA